jgi:hypothetical protein
MTHAHDLGNGQRLLVQNDGVDTEVALSSGDAAGSSDDVDRSAWLTSQSAIPFGEESRSGSAATLTSGDARASSDMQAEAPDELQGRVC